MHDPIRKWLKMFASLLLLVLIWEAMPRNLPLVFGVMGWGLIVWILVRGKRDEIGEPPA